ncbi:tyrosine-type recombinase/integrase, partial [Motilimonas sp. KMU-193]|uniref:tyrosine-type recombinase/integrase n=1 Tax=Motilimonas sp. KMU-193 TaxID=3388668 RepID=UPI00396B4730
NIVKPPQVKRLPDILTPLQVGLLISMTVKCRYQVFFLVLYTLGLRLSEGLNLTVADIDSTSMQVHIREGKGGKDRFVPLPSRTLVALRGYWATHRHPRLLFPKMGPESDSPMDKGSVQKAMQRVLVDCSIKQH